MKIEIVTHCWHYPRLLCYHLTSFLQSKTDDLLLTLIVAKSDTTVRHVCDYFQPDLGQQLQVITLPDTQVCRRTIGRNIAALATCADWVWFCDCDYVFTADCWRSLAKELAHVPTDTNLVYPQHVWSCSQPYGDTLINGVQPPMPATWPECVEMFQMRYNRAIGGAQIVRGDYCRQHGYLNKLASYHVPASSWQRTKEDVVFRRKLGSAGMAINVNHLRRIRHTNRGGPQTDVTL